MNRLRGLLALSLLFFLLSSTGLVILILDDKQDLSSRANLTPFGTKVKPLEKTPLPQNGFLPSSGKWIPVEPDFYLNINNADTIRIFHTPVDTATLSAVLGNEFSRAKPLGTDRTVLESWAQKKHSYELFGVAKKVNLWQKDTFFVLEVGSINNNSQDTIDFLRSLTIKDTVLGVTTGPDESAKLATLIRPSIAMVYNHYCATLKFFSTPGFSLSNKEYPYCLTSIGSGFFISSDGLLATNGHIVRNLPKSALFYGLSSGKLDNLLTDFLNIYLSQINKRVYTEEEIKQKVKEAHLNKEVLYQMGGLILDLNKKNLLKFQNETNDYYLQFGNQAAKVTNDGVEVGDGVVKADLVDFDYQEPTDDKGFTSSDVALLKAQTGNYPALALGSIDEAYVGSNLQVVGFPAAAMSSQSLLDNSAVSEPTFTKGVVSAIKLAKGNQKKLIQTDAIINHGNSGGPALLLNGRVVGIATYGVATEDGSGSYNYLRDIQDLKDLVSRKNLTLNQGELYNLWQKGLNNYWLGYFKYSADSFSQIKSLYPSHPLAAKYLDSSVSKIDTVEDNTPQFSHRQRSVLIYLTSFVMTLSLISASFILYLIFTRAERNNQTDGSVAV